MAENWNDLKEQNWKKLYFDVLKKQCEVERDRDEALFAAAKMADVLAAVVRNDTVLESVRLMCDVEVNTRVYAALRSKMAKYMPEKDPCSSGK